MSYSVDAARRRLPLLLLIVLVCAAIVWLVPHHDLLTDTDYWYVIPLSVPLAHLACGLSYVITARSLRRGMGILKSSYLPYGRRASMTHLAVAFLTATAEETVFRYAALMWLSSVLNPWVGLFGVSFAFALAHGFRSRRRLLDMFVFGLILGALTLATHSIYPAIVVHGMRNYILRCLLISREEWLELHLEKGGKR